MKVRIRFRTGAKVTKSDRDARRLAAGLGGLLTPAAVLAGVMALWSIAADLNWTGSFAIHAGLFSHWDVWMAAAGALQLCAALLNRFARSGEPAASSRPG